VIQRFTVLELKKNTLRVQFDTGEEKTLKRWQVYLG